MLRIVASYHCMQFQGKLKNQTWENSKKPKPSLPKFGPNSDHQNFFSKIWLIRQSLDNMVSYHHVQCQKKLMIQSWEILVTNTRTNLWTDGLRDKSNFIGRCPTNVFDNYNKNKNWRLCGNSEYYWKRGK